MCRTCGAARNGFGSHAEDAVITLFFYCFQNHFVSDNVNWQQNENMSHPLRAFCTCSSFLFPLVALREGLGVDLTLAGAQNLAAFKWCRQSPVGIGSKEGEIIAGKGLVLLWRDLFTESTHAQGALVMNLDLGIAWCFPGRLEMDFRERETRHCYVGLHIVLAAYTRHRKSTPFCLMFNFSGFIT